VSDEILAKVKGDLSVTTGSSTGSPDDVAETADEET